MPITYDSGNNRIIIDDNSNTRLNDLVAADIAQGWNVISNVNGIYICTAFITIQGATNFLIKEENIIFDTSAGYIIYSVDNNSRVVIERSSLSNSSFLPNYKQIKLSNAPILDRCLMYNFSLISIDGYVDEFAEVNHISFASCSFIFSNATPYINSRNVTLLYGATGLQLRSNMNIQDLKVYNMSEGLIVFSGSGVLSFKNLIFKNCTNDFYVRIGSGYTELNMVDSKVDRSYRVSSFGNANGQVLLLLISTFHFFTYEGSDVRIIDSIGNIVYEGNESNTPEITYSSACFQGLGPGEEVQIIETDHQPFTAIIDKPGYRTITIPDIYVTPGQPTIIRAALEGISYITETLQFEIEEPEELLMNVEETEEIQMIYED